MDISSIYQIFLNSNKVCTDSRKIKDNDLFFSLKGPNFNGNKFAEIALENGANYAIVDQKEYAVNDNYKKRKGEIIKAELYIEEFLVEFDDWTNARLLRPSILSLKK